MIEQRMTRRAAAGVAAAIALSPLGARRAAAQDSEGAADATTAPAFGADVLRNFGLPEVSVTAGPDGVSAPAELPAGPVLITLSAPAPWVAYVDVLRPPEGISGEDATRAALDAAQIDLAQPDWSYFGGTNTPVEGGSASFALDLAPGIYSWAVSCYAEIPGGEETMQLLPLTVTGEQVAPAEIPFTVDLRAEDGLRFTVAPDPAPSGPAVWRFVNASANPAAQHHAVLWRAPEGATPGAIVEGFGSLVSGTPSLGVEVVARLEWVGYFALQSSGTATWAEFDLAPGTYAVTSFVVESETSRPQVLDGMATVFRVA